MRSGIIINDNLIEELVGEKNIPVNLSRNLLKKNIDNIISEGIDKFIKNGEINVDLLSDEIFPASEEYDFFISHSHADIEIIKKLAEYLKNLGFKVFVDSEIWGSVYKLLQKFDNKICLHENGETYDYYKRNNTTSNIFLILSIALGKVIRNSNYFMFVKSNSSHKKIDNTECTYSPWLSQEINYFNFIVPNNNNIYEEITKKIACESLDESYNWRRELNIDLDYCSTLKIKDFEEIEYKK